jgi:hypothetical protein
MENKEFCLGMRERERKKRGVYQNIKGDIE